MATLNYLELFMTPPPPFQFPPLFEFQRIYIFLNDDTVKHIVYANISRVQLSIDPYDIYFQSISPQDRLKS